MKFFYAAIAIICAILTFQIGASFLTSNNIANAPDQFVISGENHDLTVVEFLSYNCPYCREIHPTIMAAIKQDGRIKYIPRPIANQGDTEARIKGAIAYSAAKQGKLKDIQTDLYEHFRPIDNKFIATIVEKHEMDFDQFNKDFGSDETKDLLNKNIELFLQIDGKATPTFIIGKKLIYVPSGKLPTVQDFLTMFAQARNE